MPVERSPDRQPADQDRRGHRGEKRPARRHLQCIGKERGEARQAPVAERDQRERDRQQQHAPLDVSVGRYARVRLVRITAERAVMIVGQAPGDDRHEQIQHGHLDTQREPAVAIHPEAERRRDGDGEARREPPVPEPFGTTASRNRRRHVGAGRGEQPRPEESVNDDDDQQEPVIGDHRVTGGKHREHETDGDQHVPLADAVADGASERRRHRRRVRQQTEEEPGRRGAAAKLDDVIRRGRQELEHGHEHREAVRAHDEEPGREQRIAHGEDEYTRPVLGAGCWVR